MCAMRHVHLQLCRLIQAGGDACCCWRQCAETRRNFDDACMLLKQQCIRRHSASSSTHGVHFVPANQCLCCCLPHSCSQLAESFTQLWQITCVTQLHVTHCTLCAFLHPCVSAHCLASHYTQIMQRIACFAGRIADVDMAWTLCDAINGIVQYCLCCPAPCCQSCNGASHIGPPYACLV